MTKKKTDHVVTGIYSFLIIVGAGYLFFRVSHFTIDDAFISFRYVANFINGKGLVYNPGERVEGYSNFLWIILLSVPALIFGSHSLVTAAKILGFLLNTGTLVLSGKIAWSLTERSRYAFVAPALLALNYTFASWGAGGLETPLYTFLVTLALHRLCNHTIRGTSDGKSKYFITGMVLALAAMTRPDGIAFTLAALILLPMLVKRKNSKTDKFATAGSILTGFLVLYAPYFLWRWSYYGWLLPNTFYAKTGGGMEQYRRGIVYFIQNVFIESNIPFLFVLILILEKVRTRLVHERLTGATLFCLVFALAGPAFILWAGGDGLFGPPRFMMHSLPAIYVLVTVGIHGLTSGWRGEPRGLKKVLPVFFVVSALLFTVSENYRNKIMEVRRYSLTDRWKLAGEWLKNNAEPGSLIAVSSAGAIAFYSGLPVIDMLGLTDVTIAHRKIATMGRGRPGHEKGDGRYVLSRKPEFILMCNGWVGSKALTPEAVPRHLHFLSEKEIWHEKTFHENYSLQSVNVGVLYGTRERVFFSFYRKLTKNNNR